MRIDQAFGENMGYSCDDPGDDPLKFPQPYIIGPVEAWLRSKSVMNYYLLCGGLKV